MRIAVIGAGSYGTCLTNLLSEAEEGGKPKHEVAMWARSPEFAAELAEKRVNEPYLPGAALSPRVAITSDLAEAVTGAGMVLAVTPSHAARDVLGRTAPHLSPDAVVVNASKGLEQGTLDRIDQVYAEIFPARIAARAAYLSGPTFAVEVAKGLPGAIVVASGDHDSARVVQAALATPRFRVYTSDDVTGVLIGGALKNVVAIAAGVSDGLGFGHNARAALITRGLAEITRMGVALGANPLTFAGLSGMGDLVLTCSGDLSRNRRVGLALGQGKSLDEIVSQMRMVAEGVKTTAVAHELSQRLGVSAPITDFMYAVLYQGQSPEVALDGLMGRSLKPERD